MEESRPGQKLNHPTGVDHSCTQEGYARLRYAAMLRCLAHIDLLIELLSPTQPWAIDGAMGGPKLRSPLGWPCGTSGTSGTSSTTDVATTVTAVTVTQ